MKSRDLSTTVKRKDPIFNLHRYLDPTYI